MRRLLSPSTVVPLVGVLLVGLGAHPAAHAARAGSGGDPLRSQQWALSLISAGKAWKLSTGRGIVVAVVDSGVDLAQPDLQGKLVPGATFAGCPKRGVSCGNGDWDGPTAPVLDFDDPSSIASGTAAVYQAQTLMHGTHVAGIIGAATHNGIGVAGVAPEAMIMPVKVLGSEVGDEHDVAAGIRWAARHGADVINLSLGGQLGSEFTAVAPEVKVMRSAVNFARKRGVVVVAAAGNNPAWPFCSPPSGLRGVLCVTGVSKGGVPMLLTSLGTFGQDLQIKSDLVAAPGGFASIDIGCGERSANSDVLSTFPTGFGFLCDGDYGALGGTSMAAPHVAGIAALLLAQCRRPRQVVSVIEKTAEIPRLGVSGNALLPYFGHGLVDAARAVAAPGARCTHG